MEILFFFPNSFSFFACFIVQSGTPLCWIRLVKVDTLIWDLWINIQSATLNTMWATVVLWIFFFYHVEVSISTLLGGFSMSGCEIFSKDIYASVNMIMWVFSFRVCMAVCINSFLSFETTLTHLVMMCYSFTYIQIFVKTFWIYDQEICGSNTNYVLKSLQCQFWSYVEANLKPG